MNSFLKITRLIVLVIVILALGGGAAGAVAPFVPQAGPPPPFTPYNWLQFNGDARHSGLNTLETSITPANVASLKKLFQVSLPAVADGAPVTLGPVYTSSGLRYLVFLTTKDGRILALDAQTGQSVWSQQHGPGTCKINNGSTTCYTTSSPAVDPGLQYVYSYGLDGFVHKYAAANGVEVVDANWPELASRKAFDEKGSSPLTVATDTGGNSYLYMPSAGYPGDNGDYQGHLTAINLATGAQQVFNTVCSSQTVHFFEKPSTPDCSEVQTAIWARAGVVYDARTNRIYMATGNGTFAPASHHWGDTVFALNPNGSGLNGNPLDTYTPANFASLQSTDADLGSTNLALLPTTGGLYPHLGVQGGKDQLLRLLNLDSLSNQAGIGHTGGELAPISVPQGGQILTAPAVWTNPADSSIWVFVANGNGISGLKLAIDGGGHPSLGQVWLNTAGGSGGTSPLVANNVLYYASSGHMRALNPTTGATLWNDTQIGGIHWESPAVSNGVLYITDELAHLTAYSLNGAGPGLLQSTYEPVVRP